MVVHHYNPNTWEAQAGRSELEAGLIYRVNSRTGQTGLHRETLSQSQEKKKKRKERERWDFQAPAGLEREEGRRRESIDMGERN